MDAAPVRMSSPASPKIRPVGLLPHRPHMSRVMQVVAAAAEGDHVGDPGRRAFAGARRRRRAGGDRLDGDAGRVRELRRPGPVVVDRDRVGRPVAAELEHVRVQLRVVGRRCRSRPPRERFAAVASNATRMAASTAIMRHLCPLGIRDDLAGDVTASLMRASGMPAMRAASRTSSTEAASNSRKHVSSSGTKIVRTQRTRRPGARQGVGGEVDAGSIRARDVQLDEELGHGATLRALRPPAISRKPVSRSVYACRSRPASCDRLRTPSFA